MLRKKKLMLHDYFKRSRRKVIRTAIIVSILSVTVVGSAFAESKYTTNANIISTGKIIYNDAATGENVILDSADLTTLADTIDEVNNNLVNVSTELTATKKSVSDGKSGIASAITEKGVSTASDATFKVLHDNIISMALKQYNTGYGSGYIDGQKSVNTNANITYVKHYHTGNSGQNGGCFTTANYHRHIEGQCYYKCGSHSKGNMIRISSEHYSGKGDLTEYYCNTCGIRINTWSGREEAALFLNNGRGWWEASYIVYRCGKSTSTIDNFSPSCGYTDGQILSATITY